MHHNGPVNAVAVTPDGTQIISASNDTTVRIWDRATGDEVRVLTGHTTWVLGLALTPNGNQIVSCSRGGTVRIWDRATGDLIGEPMTKGLGAVNAVAVIDDTRIVAGHEDGELIIWDLTTGEQFGEPLVGPTNVVSAVTVTPDGTEIISGGADGMWEWDLGGRSGARFTGYTESIRAVVVPPDGAQVITGGGDGTVRIWDRASGDPVGVPFIAHSSPVRAVAVTPDGERIIATGTGGVTRIWDRATGQSVGEPRTGHTGEILAIAVTPDSSHFVSGGDDGQILIWELPANAEVLHGHHDAVHAVAVSGNLIASGSKDGTVRIWDRTKRHAVRRPLTGHSGGVNAVAFTPDGAVVSGCDDHILRIWDDYAGQPPTEIQTGHTGGIRAIIPDGNQIISAGWGRVMQIWDRATQQLATEIETDHRGGIRAIAVDGDQIISTGADGAVQIWYRDTGKPVGGPLIEKMHIGPVNALALVPGAIITGGERGVRIWNRTTGQPDQLLTGAGPIWAVVVAGDRIIGGGAHGLVRIWDLTTGELSNTLTGHAGPVYGLAVSGDQIISGGADGTVRIWDQPVVPQRDRLAEVVSDLESDEDRLGIAGDVNTIAAMVAALSTRPPLSVALLGDWGIGKSSFMRQVRDRVEALARSGGNVFAANVRQVRFNAWHYSDDHLWVGLVEHLFRELAKPAGEEPAGEKITDLEVRLSARRAERERLDTDLRAVDRVDTGRGWLGKVWLPFRSARVARAAVAGVWREFRSSWWRVLLALAIIGAGAVAVVLGAGVLRWVGGVAALVVATVAPAVSAWRRIGEFTEQARRELLERKSEVDSEITAVEEKLARLDPARRLDRLLAEISTAERYESYRGLTGSIHHDLRRLSDDLTSAQRHWEEAGRQGRPPLQRIVLYVDDLDRCTPRRVVDVLQAVNLLLTMELFVVVVAVDPRWLLKSLERHHEGLFDEGAVAYLDKIFHIPFALRPMGDRAVHYLRSLLPATEESDAPREPDSIPARRAPAIERRAPEHPDIPQQQQVQAQRVLPAIQPAASPSPEGLRLRVQERDFLARLTPLLPTPRAIKKLVNLYRLLRLGIPDRQLDEFIGDNKGGPYQAAALLLAALVGMPHRAQELLAGLALAEPGRDIVDLLDGWALRGAIEEIRKEFPVHGDSLTYRTWATTVARYGFETYDLFTGDQR